MQKNQIKENYLRRRNSSIAKLLTKENKNNPELMLQFKSWASVAYDRGYKDAITDLEAKYIRNYVSWAKNEKDS